MTKSKFIRINIPYNNWAYLYNGEHIYLIDLDELQIIKHIDLD
jgi:hypothetical protein